MKSIAVLVLAFAAFAVAAPVDAKPVKLSKQQLSRVVAGSNPNIAPNGTNVNSNGRSGAPGNSFHPGH